MCELLLSREEDLASDALSRLSHNFSPDLLPFFPRIPIRPLHPFHSSWVSVGDSTRLSLVYPFYDASHGSKLPSSPQLSWTHLPIWVGPTLSSPVSPFLSFVTRSPINIIVARVKSVSSRAGMAIAGTTQQDSSTSNARLRDSSPPSYSRRELSRQVIDELVETSPRTAILFALTCRSLEEPTLSSLWKKRHYLTHLVRVLQSHLGRK